jgi:hypothetical protein
MVVLRVFEGKFGNQLQLIVWTREEENRDVQAVFGMTVYISK